MCWKIASAIEFLWNNKVVHRDMKLDNIVLSASNSPILRDFGLSVFVNDGGTCKVDRPGGNLSHLAPEILNEFKKQHSNEQAIVEIDFSKQPSWELGLVCFEIACGEHPFGDYPLGFPETPHLAVPELKIGALQELNFPEQFISILVGLLKNDAKSRLDIKTACALLHGCCHN